MERRLVSAPGGRRRWITEVWVPVAGDLLVVAAVVLAVDRGDEVAALFLALFAVLIALLALYNAQHIRLEVDAGSDEQSDATVSDETPPEGA
jgi:hypothetical protein